MTIGRDVIDANILLDIFTDDPRWAAWSIETMSVASLSGPLFINDVVYAELSVGFGTPDELDEKLARVELAVAPTPKAALFLAGKIFKRYRASSGVRTGVLPDFFIGAHAAVAGLKLLTRDACRFRTYFPEVDLVTP